MVIQEMPAEYSVFSVVTGGDENRVTGLLTNNIAKKTLIPSVVKSIQNKQT